MVETKNSQRTAETLNISATSVSRALAKLREHFGDNIFIRQPHGIEPSELAYELALASKSMLLPLESVIAKRTIFNQHTYNGTITIIINTYLLELFANKIIDALIQSFPKAKLNLECWNNDSLLKLLNGDIDYGLQFDGFPFPSEIYTPVLCKVENRLVLSEHHPLLEKNTKPEWDTLTEFPIVQLKLTGINQTRSNLSVEYLRRGFTPNIKLKTDSLRAAYQYLQKSKAIMFGSTVIADAFPHLLTLPLPIIREELKYTVIKGAYLRTRRENPLHKYIHQIIVNVFSNP